MDMLIHQLDMDELHLRSMAPHSRDGCFMHNKEGHERLYPAGANGIDSYTRRKHHRPRIPTFASCLPPSTSTSSPGDSNLDVNARLALDHCSINATVAYQPEAGLLFLSSIWWPTLPVTKLDDSASGGASISYSASNPDRDTKLGQATAVIPSQALWQTKSLKCVRFLRLHGHIPLSGSPKWAIDQRTPLLLSPWRPSESPFWRSQSLRLPKPWKRRRRRMKVFSVILIPESSVYSPLPTSVLRSLPICSPGLSSRAIRLRVNLDQ
ncbi:hypothetical protein BKA70DRAFT_245560 [Coprinopsis sp. MPI-PUGE-AT-0042]|nr:hypothetical protein BKA70DRAFT_245560 [Coprinopsis sp. MPI-PUGE-AT-0042]